MVVGGQGLDDCDQTGHRAGEWQRQRQTGAAAWAGWGGTAGGVHSSSVAANPPQADRDHDQELGCLRPMDQEMFTSRHGNDIARFGVAWLAKAVGWDQRARCYRIPGTHARLVSTSCRVLTSGLHDVLC
jgi:hypothetical protein